MGYGFFFPVFIGLLIPLLIILIVVYAKTSKLFNMIYVLSVFSYINLIIYWIDAYELRKNAVILLLVLSAVVMILFGRDLANRKKKSGNAKAKKTKAPSRLWMYIPLGLIIFVAIVGMFEIGVSIETNPVISLQNSDLIYSNCSLMKYDYNDYISIMNVTVKNDFIVPRRVALGYTVCSDDKSRFYETIMYEGNERKYEYMGNAVEVDPFSQKIVSFYVNPICDERTDRQISKLYLVPHEDERYVDCFSLTQKQIDSSVVINLTD